MLRKVSTAGEATRFAQQRGSQNAGRDSRGSGCEKGFSHQRLISDQSRARQEAVSATIARRATIARSATIAGTTTNQPTSRSQRSNSFRTRRHNRYQHNRHQRDGFLLLVVLVMIVLLSLLAAGYTYMVRSHVDTVHARVRRFKARMAAEAGMQHAVVLLRYQQGELDAWYNDPEVLRAVPMVAVGEEAGIESIENTSDVRTYDPTADEVFRYHLIAPDPDNVDTVRYGFTDECARLDINVATEAQLRTLFDEIIPTSTDIDVDTNELVAALLDWREPGNSPRPGGGKDEYYQQLRPPYRAKKAPFSTVEELLLVKGFSGWVLYGEDYNRNGLLEPNEDDGDESFPPDDADGTLFQGVERYLTIWAQDANTSADNRPRIFLNNQDLERLQEQLEEEFDGDIVSYIMNVRSAGTQFNSVMNLLPAPPPPEVDENDQQQNDNPSNDETPPATQTSGDGDSGDGENQNSEDSGDDSSDQGQDGAGSENTPSNVPPTYVNLTEEEPPGTYEDLPQILDRLTVQQLPFTQGRINVSTAAAPVLAAIPNLTDAEVNAMVEAREQVPLAERSSPAWVLTSGAIDENRFRQILDSITTKGAMYRIESLGYADNLGVVERLMVVIQMRGPIPQVIYYRNLNELGPAYTPHGDERRDLAGRSD